MCVCSLRKELVCRKTCPSSKLSFAPGDDYAAALMAAPLAAKHGVPLILVDDQAGSLGQSQWACDPHPQRNMVVCLWVFLCKQPKSSTVERKSQANKENVRISDFGGRVLSVSLARRLP